jgi:2'-5' RNA ligase
VPHVSLVRLKRPGNAERVLEAARLEASPAHFDELRLYRSVLTPAGGIYSVLARWPLSGPAAAPGP